MDRRINEGIIDLNERKQKINEENIHVLEQVKDILTIEETDLITVQMCANYFEVDKNVLEVLISRNREELEENGLKVYKRKEFRELALNLHNVSLEISKYKDSLKLIDMTLDITNRGITLLNKRTLLNVGMLLRDSKIAKELRRRILDVVHDAENGNGSIETVANEIDEEKKLSMELGAAIVKGNLSKVVEITTKINELKNKRILELQPKADWFTDFMARDGSYTSTQIAKLFDLSSAKKLNKLLYENKVIFKQGESWLPYATTDKSWYKMVVGNKDGFSYSQLRFTPIGIYGISKILNIKFTEEDLSKIA
jgi:phage antirepressor YoqD-like protein